MNNIEFYIDEAKRKSGIKSDRKMAEFLGLSHSATTQWKTGRALPTEQTMARLAQVAKMDVDTALLELGIWRSSGLAQKAYASILQRLQHAALAILAVKLAYIQIR